MLQVTGYKLKGCLSLQGRPKISYQRLAHVMTFVSTAIPHGLHHAPFPPTYTEQW